MDSEVKWFMLMIMVTVLCMFTAVGVGEYSKHQCKMAYAQSSRTVDEIEQICK
jgi:hypothetical protein